jgi:hypothetical protein
VYKSPKTALCKMAGLAAGVACAMTLAISAGLSYTTLHPHSRPINQDESTKRPRGGALNPAPTAPKQTSPVISAPPIVQPGNNGPAINLAPTTASPKADSSPFVTPSLTAPDAMPAINPASLNPSGNAAAESPGTAGDSDSVTSGSIMSTPLDQAIVRDALEASKVREELIMPKEEVIFLTKFGQVRIQEGAMALLIDDDHAATIFDLHDAHGKSVTVESNGKVYHLAPGKTITLCPTSVKDFISINRMKYVAYRQMKNEEVTPDIRAFRADYQVQSLISHYPGFRRLLSSKDSRERHLADQVLKTAMIVDMGTINARGFQVQHEQYSYMVPALPGVQPK